MTPLQELDDAIHRFLQRTGQADKAITGWVVGCSTSRLEPRDDDTLPLITGARYALGPQTSLTNATGIIEFLSVVMERETWRMVNNDEDDI